jgi:hypothetical protein
MREANVKLNDSRISDPEIPKSQVGRKCAEKNGRSTFSQIFADAPVRFKVSGFRDLRSWNRSISHFTYGPGVLVIVLLIALAGPTTAHAQQRGGAAARSGRDAAPIDLTGYWVSYVTENWRYRMVTPAKGEYRRIPSSPAAVPLINAWDPAADERAGNQCKSYGAGNIMSVPGRLHITWQDAETLRIDTDAGTQTRLFHFSRGSSTAASPAATSSGPQSWQGESTATWEPATGGNAGGGGGSLRVVTSNLRAGYLRKNGVPYSERTTVTEHFDVASLPDGSKVLLVTTIVEDPLYLTGPYVVSPHFKKEADGSKWDPTPCSSNW